MPTDQTTSEAEGAGMPQPDARLRELEFFVGHWNAAGVFHDTPFGPRKNIEMRISTQSVNRGFWVLNRTEELPTPENPAPLTAHYMWGYDVATDEFAANWFDSNGGHAVQRSKGWDGDDFVFEGVMTMAGNSVPLRDTFRRTGTDSYHHIGEVNLGNGWIPVDEEIATRVQG